MLICVETTDIVFAVDSIPAIFAITRDPFIVYTSNIFAILGLRALYFVLAGVMGQFHFLRFGLALVLVFVGMKMMLTDLYKCRSRHPSRLWRSCWRVDRRLLLWPPPRARNQPHRTTNQ